MANRGAFNSEIFEDNFDYSNLVENLRKEQKKPLTNRELRRPIPDKEDKPTTTTISLTQKDKDDLLFFASEVGITKITAAVRYLIQKERNARGM